jgi:hypothetical protein
MWIPGLDGGNDEEQECQGLGSDGPLMEPPAC